MMEAPQKLHNFLQIKFQKEIQIYMSADSKSSYITKGAKVTRSSSAYALPLFLSRPENLKQKAPVQGKNNPEIPFPAPF